MTSSRLVVASYNVHRCVGADGRHDPERTARVIRELDADVVALQEVDARYHLEDGLDQFEMLARLTGYEAVPGPTLESHRGQYGNALLSRIPIERVRKLDLSFRRREPRGALDVELGWAGRGLRVIATHLGLARAERQHQVARLRSVLPEGNHPLVLLGDLNEWRPASRGLGPLVRYFGHGRRVRTFPARLPVVPLDHVFVQPQELVRDLRAHRSPLARRASDHLPVVAELEGS